VRLRPEHANHVWSYDFVSARTHDGRTVRMLNLIDEHSRECLMIRPERRWSSAKVIEALADVMVMKGVPEHLRSDNGPEFVARVLRKWLAGTGAKTAYIEPGSPWENGYCESFNSKLRDEFLNGETFYSMKEIRVLAERWRVHYNTVRPHSSRGYRPPAPEAVSILLSWADIGWQQIAVERDEDIEVGVGDSRLYIQVKKRASNLTFGDIADAMVRFDRVRDEHQAGRRTGVPQFWVISNSDPGPDLLGRLRQAWPGDVYLRTPTTSNGDRLALPPPGSDLDQMGALCVQLAERIPHTTLQPQTLVWKLAALILLLSTGTMQAEHTIAVLELQPLLEQLITQLQSLPRGGRGSRDTRQSLRYWEEPWRNYVVGPVHHRCRSILAKHGLGSQWLDDWPERLSRVIFRTNFRRNFVRLFSAARPRTPALV
jgi:hypothetical protein